MEAEFIEEHELLEFGCTDGSQIIIATSEEVIAASESECDTRDSIQCRSLPDGTQLLHVLHQAEADDGNLRLQATQSNANLIGVTLVEDFIESERSEERHRLPTEDRPRKSSNGFHTCQECGVKFVSKKALSLHSTVHVDEASYACEFCSATSIHWTEMWQHQCCNVDCAPIVCPQCHKTVSNKKQLQIHEEVHNLQRRFTSRKMDGYFQRKLQDAEDPEVDWGAKPFICGVCGKPFAKLYEVEYHEKLHNLNRPAPHTCEKCGLFYLSKHDLNKHVALGCNVELSRKIGGPFPRRNCKTNL